jgi:hypothetical protein
VINDEINDWAMLYEQQWLVVDLVVDHVTLTAFQGPARTAVALSFRPTTGIHRAVPTPGLRVATAGEGQTDSSQWVIPSRPARRPMGHDVVSIVDDRLHG